MSMTCTEEYKEHIVYTFHAFCRVVIRNAMYTAVRTRNRKYNRALQPVFAIQIHYNAALVKSVMTSPKFRLDNKTKIFFFRFHLQDRCIIILKMVICPLP